MNRALFAAVFCLSIVFQVIGTGDASAQGKARDFCSIFKPCAEGYSCSDLLVGECELIPNRQPPFTGNRPGETFSARVGSDNVGLHSDLLTSVRCPPGHAMAGIAAFIGGDVYKKDQDIRSLRPICHPYREPVPQNWFASQLGDQIGNDANYTTPEHLLCPVGRYIRGLNLGGAWGLVFMPTDRLESVEAFCSKFPGEQIDISTLRISKKAQAPNISPHSFQQTACPESEIATGVIGKEWGRVDGQRRGGINSLALICKSRQTLLSEAAAQSINERKYPQKYLAAVRPRYEITWGAALQGAEVIANYDKKEITFCADRCDENDRCRSFSYQNETGSCRLNGAITGSARLGNPRDGGPVDHFAKKAPPPAQPQTQSPPPDPRQACIAYLNGQGARYDSGIANTLCRNGEYGIGPAACFLTLMSGKIPWDFRGFQQALPNQYSQWIAGNALLACSNTPGAEFIPGCIVPRIGSNQPFGKAIDDCRVTFGGTAVMSGLPNNNGAQPDQQPVRKTGPSARPEFNRVWQSTKGNIHWGQGWFNQRNFEIRFSIPQWDAARNAFVSHIEVGDRNKPDANGNTIFANGIFYFDSSCSFSGEWWYPADPQQKMPWTGQCIEPFKPLGSD